MNRYLLFFLSIPKILWVNFRFLPWRQAVKLPLFVSYDSVVRLRRGGIIFDCPVRRGLVHLGFWRIPVCDCGVRSSIIVGSRGTLVFRGSAFMGEGTKLIVVGGHLVFGDHFRVTGTTSICCYHYIEFGTNFLGSWECLIMDSDCHPILGANGEMVNSDRPIKFGDNVWMGCRCTILKGTVVPADSVIGAASFLGGGKFSPRTIIAGHPARSAKDIMGWAYKL